MTRGLAAKYVLCRAREYTVGIAELYGLGVAIIDSLANVVPELAQKPDDSRSVTDQFEQCGKAFQAVTLTHSNATRLAACVASVVNCEKKRTVTAWTEQSSSSSSHAAFDDFVPLQKV